jgi:cell division protein FtsB
VDSVRRNRRVVRSRSSLVLRWFGALVVVAVAVAYVHPVRAYREALEGVSQREARLAALARENARLERRLAQAGTAAFVEREARRLGLVRPGERLYIVRATQPGQGAGVR